MATFNYVDENGEVQEIEVNANDIQALDVEGYYDNKNLEDILETLGEANRLYLVENEEQIKKGKAGIYFCDDILDDREDNNVVKRVKDYLNSIAGDLSNLKTNDKTNLVNAINENTSYLKENTQKLTLVKLTTGDNLNTIINTQVEYYVENDGLVSGILNLPSGVTHGFHIKFIKTNTNTLYGKQVLISRVDGNFERVYENGVFGSWVKVPSKIDIDALTDKTIPVLLASGVFSTGNTITLSQAITNFARIVFSYGDGGSETLMHVGWNYPSNIAVAEVFKGVTTLGNYEITITNATTITVTNASTKYIRKIYGFKF